MILQVLSDAGNLGDLRDSMGDKLAARPDSGQQQQLGAAVGAGAEHYFMTRLCLLDFALLFELDSDRALALEQNPPGVRVLGDRQPDSGARQVFARRLRAAAAAMV